MAKCGRLGGPTTTRRCARTERAGRRSRLPVAWVRLAANRTKDVDALIDSEIGEWLESQDDLRLITYRDL